MTHAESLDLPEGEEAAVEEMWRELRFEPADGGIDGLEIHWHARQRPIQIEYGPPLPGEIEETLEALPDSDLPGAVRVRGDQSRRQTFRKLASVPRRSHSSYLQRVNSRSTATLVTFCSHHEPQLVTDAIVRHFNLPRASPT